MKVLLTAFVICTVSSSAIAQNNGSRNVQVGSTLNNYVEYHEKNLSATTPDGKVIVKSMHDLDSQLSKAISFYDAEDYAAAFPLLSELAQWGVKRAQLLIGDIYIAGRHGEQSTIRGLAWLGVANEKKTERLAGKVFKEVYKQLDDEQQKYVDTVVGTFIEKYGVDAQNYKCRKRTVVGTNIPQMECTKIPNSTAKLYPIS